MERNYKAGQRCIAIIIMISLLLQSCYNPGIRTNNPASGEKEDNTSIAAPQQEREERSQEIASKVLSVEREASYSEQGEPKVIKQILRVIY